VEQTYFRKGFGLKGAIEGALVSDYHSRVVDAIRGAGYALTVGDVTFRLATAPSSMPTRPTPSSPIAVFSSSARSSTTRT